MCCDTLLLVRHSEEILEYLERLELTGFVRPLEGKESTLGRDSGNEALLNAFLSRGWIEGYSANEQDETLFQVQWKAIRETVPQQ